MICGAPPGRHLSNNRGDRLPQPADGVRSPILCREEADRSRPIPRHLKTTLRTRRCCSRDRAGTWRAPGVPGRDRISCPAARRDHAGAQRMHAGEERIAPGRAALLGVVVGELRTFIADAIGVGVSPTIMNEFGVEPTGAGFRGRLTAGLLATRLKWEVGFLYGSVTSG